MVYFVFLADLCVSTKYYNHCNAVLDDDFETCKELGGGDEVSPNIQKLEVNPNCLNTTDVSE